MFRHVEQWWFARDHFLWFVSVGGVRHGLVYCVGFLKVMGAM